MYHSEVRSIRILLLAAELIGAVPGSAQQLRVELKPTMLTNEADVGDPSGLVDEQRQIIGPPAGKKPGFYRHHRHHRHHHRKRRSLLHVLRIT